MPSSRSPRSTARPRARRTRRAPGPQLRPGAVRVSVRAGAAAGPRQPGGAARACAGRGGGGGGGSHYNLHNSGGSGGSGIVIIKYKSTYNYLTYDIKEWTYNINDISKYNNNLIKIFNDNKHIWIRTIPTIK